MSATTSAESSDRRGDWLSGRRLDGVVAVLSLWMIAGIFLDGRSHAHGAPESFFTLEHVVFYTAFLALAAVFGLVVVREGTRSGRLRDALPQNHRFSLLGVAVFGLGGLADLVWHTVFGIESDVEALLSPTHLMLVAGALLLASTPLRRAWRSGLGEGWREQAPALLSATLVLSMLLFITIYANLLTGLPLALPEFVAADIGPVHTEGVEHVLISRAMAAVMAHTAIVMGVALALVGRFGPRLAPGFFTIALSVSGLGVAAFIGGIQFVPALVLAGLTADLLYWRLRPSLHRPWAVRVFATVVPLALYAGYFVLQLLTEGIPLTVHVWTGAIVIAGATGYLLSLLAVAPAGGADRETGVASDSDD